MGMAMNYMDFCFLFVFIHYILLLSLCCHCRAEQCMHWEKPFRTLHSFYELRTVFLPLLLLVLLLLFGVEWIWMTFQVCKLWVGNDELAIFIYIFFSFFHSFFYFLFSLPNKWGISIFRTLFRSMVMNTIEKLYFMDESGSSQVYWLNWLKSFSLPFPNGNSTNSGDYLRFFEVWSPLIIKYWLK